MRSWISDDIKEATVFVKNKPKAESSRLFWLDGKDADIHLHDRVRKKLADSLQSKRLHN